MSPEKYNALRSLDLSGKVTLAKGADGRKYVLKELPEECLPVFRRIAGIPEQENLMKVCEVIGSTAVCEYYPGNSLDELIAGDGSFPVSQIRRMICQLCRAVERLHLCGIIHRDITPKNIIISDKGDLTLIDFGIARVFTGSRDRDTTICGTEGFAPPEQFGFRETSPTADIYSIGMILKLLLNNCTDCSAAQEVLLRKCAAKCTRFDPGKRYKSAGALRRAVSRTAWLLPVSITAGAILTAAAAVTAAVTAQSPRTDPQSHITPSEYSTVQTEALPEIIPSDAESTAEPPSATSALPANTTAQTQTTTATTIPPQTTANTTAQPQTTTATTIPPQTTANTTAQPQTTTNADEQPQELHPSYENADRISVSTVINDRGYYEDVFTYEFFDDPTVHGSWEYRTSLPVDMLRAGTTADNILTYPYTGGHIFGSLTVDDHGKCEWYTTEGEVMPLPLRWTNGYLICEFTEGAAAQEMFTVDLNGDILLFVRLKLGDFSQLGEAEYYEIYTPMQ